MTIKRYARHAAGFAVLTPAMLMAQTALPVAAVQTRAAATWQNPGSDIPVDAAWRLGTLPNGVRYAVRRGSQPPGVIAVRVRIGIGALVEEDGQLGWTHLLEHMVFRGTASYPDGEGIKLWQRLGATFGSDTNAATTQTSTTFQLDLPHPDTAGYGQAMAVLAEMLDSARIDPALLATERRVVDAERAQRYSPLLTKLRDVQLPLIFAGTKAAKRDVIGTSASLAAASSPALKAYYEKWYRPDNAVVVVVGDADPAVLEAGIRQAFGKWQATGARPADPDYGTPAAPRQPAATIIDAQAPDTVLLAFVSPHPLDPFTALRQQQQFARRIAVGILNQRFAAAAQRGGALLNAGVSFGEQRHVQDQLLVQVQPKAGQWQPALNEAFAILNGAASSPPQQAEIDQQASGIATYLAQEVASASTRTSAELASGFIADVDQGDVSGAQDYYAQLFAAQRPALTPAAVQAVIRRLVVPAPRLVVISPTAIAGNEATVGAALASAQKVAGAQQASLRAVSLDQLKLAGRPAAIVGRTDIAALAAERVRFANGVELVFKKTGFEKDRVRVLVEVGRGLLGEPRGQQGLWWTASGLAAGGVGPFTPDELARVAAGRQIGFAIAPGIDALSLSGVTNAADVGDMLKLMTGTITQPRFEATAVARLKEATAANYASVFSQPVAVLGAFGGAALHGGDMRFQGLPPLGAVNALTLADFQRFWSERLPSAVLTSAMSI